jgi:serine/threonine protein phosphatase PrpC
MPLRLEYAGLTDVGLQRAHNEDAILLEPAVMSFVVCDGMGGHASGAVASQLAVTTIAEALRTPRPAGSPPLEPLVAAILAANEAVYTHAQIDPQCHGMGTTVVGVRFEGDRVHICHIGDSRIYLLRGQGLQQLTRDHSLINLYADHPEMIGRLGPAHSNVIVRAVGLHPQVEVEHSIVEIEPGDLYLLCSDGLIDMTEDWMVRDMLSAGADLETTAANLVRTANAHGGADNVSVVLVKVIADDPQSALTLDQPL